MEWEGIFCNFWDVSLKGGGVSFITHFCFRLPGMGTFWPESEQSSWTHKVEKEYKRIWLLTPIKSHSGHPSAAYKDLGETQNSILFKSLSFWGFGTIVVLITCLYKEKPNTQQFLESILSWAQLCILWWTQTILLNAQNQEPMRVPTEICWG